MIRRSGFTLIELLVVVTMLVALLAMLEPALDKAMDSAQKAVCGTNLKGIGNGSIAYALSNRQALVICRGRFVQIAFNALGTQVYFNTADDAKVDWPAALASVGLASETGTQFNGVAVHLPTPIWNCPSRGFKSFWDGGQLVVGYQYLAGLEYWYNPYAGALPPRSPKRLSTSSGDWALAADATMRMNRTWGDEGSWPQYYRGIPPHRGDDGLTPAGHNQAYMDGSVEWVPAHRLIDIGNWWGTYDHQVFWFQRDLGGWNPPDDAYAVPPKPF